MKSTNFMIGKLVYQLAPLCISNFKRRANGEW